MSKPSPRRATTRPMRPSPTMPRVARRMSTPRCGCQSPRRSRGLHLCRVAEQGGRVVMQSFLHRGTYRCQHVGDVAPGGAGTEQVTAFVTAVYDLGADRIDDVEWVV